MLPALALPTTPPPTAAAAAAAPTLALLPPNVAAPALAAVAPTTLPFPAPHRPPFEHPDEVDGDDDVLSNLVSANPTDPIISVTMTPPPAPTTTPDPGTPFSPSATQRPTECRLLGSFAILVQLALGALALLSLVYKRWRERPQRPVRVWFFDASKQVFGSVLVHAANVFMSLLTSGKVAFEVVDAAGVVAAAGGGRGVVRRVVWEVMGMGSGVAGMGGLVGRGEKYVPNPCSFYLLNLGIDTTLGIPILIVIVRVLTRLVALTPLGSPLESIQSGNYGTPPRAWWWLKQSVIYFCGLMGMKLCVLILFMMLPWLPHVGDWALGWTEGNEKLQIVFVMMLFPLIMNALQYYIIDSYIKKQEPNPDDDHHHHHHIDTSPDGTVVYDELAASESDESCDEAESDKSGSDSDSDSEAGGGGRRGNGRKGARLRLARRNSAAATTPLAGAVAPGRLDVEYDPAVDGDSQTVIGSSSSSRGGVMPKELLPPEGLSG